MAAMKIDCKLFVPLLAIALAAQTAGAWSLFGTSSSNAAGRLKSADRLLEKADTAFEEGDVAAAGKGYVRALEKYRVIAKDYPEFNDGIAAIRVDYCISQLAECGVTPEGEEMTPGDAARQEDGKATAKEDAATPPQAAVAPSDAASLFRAMSGEPAPADGNDADAGGDTDGDAETPATTYNPRYLAYDFGEARELVEQGRHADAIDILVPMVKFDPENRQFRMLLAAARLGAGQSELAITALEDLRGRREDFPLLLLISAAYTSAGRYTDALLALDTAAKLAPGEPDPYSNLAWLTLLMNGQTPEAISLAAGNYKQALKRGAARDPALEAIIGAK